MPMHLVRLPVQNLGIARCSCDFKSFRPGASTTKITNLFFRKPSETGLTRVNINRILIWKIFYQRGQSG
jgi:hypothetical protein